jgi:hypothetical protein
MVIASSAPTLTILENGDRLNRIEFERRYSLVCFSRLELLAKNLSSWFMCHLFLFL